MLFGRNSVFFAVLELNEDWQSTPSSVGGGSLWRAQKRMKSAPQEDFFYVVMLRLLFSRLSGEIFQC